MRSMYGYVEIPKSEYRYLDLPETEKVRKKRRRRRRNTRSTAENSSEGVTIIEGNNTVRVNKRTNEPKKKVAKNHKNTRKVTEEISQQQTKHSLYRKPKKLEINIEWNGGKALSNWDYESNKLLNSTN
ncbi:hypothetical protein [Bacillus cereus]|uniref:hypothetical protein n=1 Tax=Bacillus cereus TaxID=1396 RepID=UPI00123AA4B7|nr:hypothetical protein [Bacillus cereus]KAA6477513.1 hypothetical protein DX931_03690 [Bacillus cereus]